MSTVHHQPVDGRPYRVTMGLRPLEPSLWLEFDEHVESELAEKHKLLAIRPGDVLAWTDAGLAPSRELLEMVVDALGRHHPDRPAEPDAGLHPIDAAGRLVQEDLCVLTRDAGAWTLVAASVCFPSRWDLAQKIGRPLRAIHEPVPGYERIATATNSAFDRLVTQRPMWRLNWSLLDSPDLFQNSRHGPVQADDPAGLTFRVERQTIRRMPRTSAIVFTIRTYRTPLADLVVGRPHTARAFADTLRTVPADSRAYKGWTESMPAILEYLQRHISDTTAARVAGDPTGMSGSCS